jgi:hypothetical protein
MALRPTPVQVEGHVTHQPSEDRSFGARSRNDRIPETGLESETLEPRRDREDQVMTWQMTPDGVDGGNHGEEIAQAARSQ